jgi:hypothetical protein
MAGGFGNPSGPGDRTLHLLSRGEVKVSVMWLVNWLAMLYAASTLTPSNPIFPPPAYSPALIYFRRERGWWITCNYPTVLKEKNRKSTTCAICWLKSVLHEEKLREQENHNVGRGLKWDQKGLNV